MDKVEPTNPVVDRLVELLARAYAAELQRAERRQNARSGEENDQPPLTSHNRTSIVILKTAHEVVDDDR